MNEPLHEAARRWIDADPDPVTRSAGQAVLDSGDEAALAEHFGAHLTFGTAGLRGALGPGPNRMNRAVVRRASAGFGQYLLRTVPDARARGVVVGFDGRHGSRTFAEDTAAVLGGLGLPVYLYENVVPTPQLAHAVRFLGCAGGVMVTASHNPPQDNGYKVYWGDGAQIVPPQDEGISACIEAVGPAREIAVPALSALRVAGTLKPVPDAVLTRYLDEVAAARVWDGPTDLRIVYTAMHGVGRALVERVLRGHGYEDLHLVAAQADPDPDFPTVRFPNPEEPGALDLALALAREVGADLLIANDPDADRLAVAVPDGRGGYQALTGDQVGVLLADELLRYGPADDRPRLVATTIVSSSMLSRVAAAHGAAYAEALTGFKWLAHLALRHEAGGGRFVMGYEEALGYSVGSIVRDKDGVSAALVFADLAARCRREGRSVLDRLVELYRTHGFHLNVQRSVKLPGLTGAERIKAAMSALRSDPPGTLAGARVLRLRDLLTGEALDLASGARSPIDLPRSDVLAFDLEDGGRVLARPSGTEPKIKFYFEVRSPLGADEPLAAAAERARARVEALATDLLDRAGVR